MKKDIKDRRLIVVSNRLPYLKNTDKKGKVTWEKSSGGLVTALDPILKQKKGIWIGWDGSFTEKTDIKQMEQHDISEIGFSDDGGSYKIASIPMTEKEVDEYYNHFSNNTLWGLFHYFFEKSSIDYASWETYKKINERFANYISKIATEDDIIWVNDFHLFLCPLFLRKINPKFKIHFFLHIPFPHVDIFSILPWYNEILESLSCCNSVGFHHRRYLKNFNEAITLYKKEKLDNNIKTIEEKIRTFIFVGPIGIDFEKYNQTSKKPEVIKRRDELVKQNNGSKMILGVDRLDYSKGIKERIMGIEKLLESHPELVGKFNYYQIAVPSREAVSTYQDLKKSIDELVGRVNGKFSTGTWMPIHYMYTSVDFNELVAMYSAADIALITPLRDGMNLVCKEYVASHSDNDGILILSKFTGAFTEIKNSLAVNPYSIENIANAIYRAMHMEKPERVARMKKMRKNIATNDINTWLEKCLSIFEYTIKGEADV